MEDNKIEFVQLSEGDIKDCDNIYFSAFSKHELIRSYYNAEGYFKKYISDSDKYAYGIRYEGKLVGCMTAIQLPAFFSEYTIYIDVVAVLPEYQGKGIGTKMLDSFFEKAAVNATVSLNTDKNGKGYDFYLKNNFFDDNTVHLTRFCVNWDELEKKVRNEIEKSEKETN